MMLVFGKIQSSLTTRLCQSVRNKLGLLPSEMKLVDNVNNGSKTFISQLKIEIKNVKPLSQRNTNRPNNKPFVPGAFHPQTDR